MRARIPCDPNMLICKANGCDRAAKSHGLCNTHNERRRKGRPVDGPIVTRQPGRLCSIEGCDKPHSARGWCEMHYCRWKKHGDPLITLHGNVVKNFWVKVEKKSNEECWMWTAGTSPQGYGIFWDGRRNVSAHVHAYRLAYGPVPLGLQIDHRCGVRACVNPEHLRCVSSKQNNENRHRLNRNNKSGVRGVSWNMKRQRWIAQICHEGKQMRVGSFHEISDAEAAVIAKRNELFTHNDMDRHA